MNAVKLALVAATMLGVTGIASAQPQYPSRQITVVVPFAPGGQIDIEARALAQSMEQRFKQSVIVDNKVGASGAIGLGHVAKAAPDGYTILVSGAGSAVIHLTQKNLGFDNTKDLLPVSLLSSGTSLVVTNKQTGTKTWQAFIDYTRQNPGKVNYASGVASLTLAWEAIKGATGTFPMTEIPYKGMSDYMTAALRDEVQLILGTIGGFKPHVESGAYIPLMQISEKRNQSFPDVPTSKELGYGDRIRPFAWTGVFVPAGTPTPIVDALYREIAYYVKQPEALRRAAGFHTDLYGSSPEEFKKTYDADVTAWTAVARSINLQPQ